MKKFILTIAVALCAMYVAAEIKFQHLDNVKGTNIVFVDDDAKPTYAVTDAIFITDGKEYKVKKIRCDVNDGVATIKLKFKKCKVFKDCKVELTINGQKQTLPLNLGR